MRYKTMPIRRLKGLNEDENPAEVADDELTVSLNCYRRGRTKGTRPGFLRDPDVYTSSMTGPVQGIVHFQRSNGSVRDVVIVENGLVREAPGADVNGALTFNTSAPWTFAVYNDVLYAAGGTLDDDHWSWTGSGNITARAILNLSAVAIFPAYVFHKWNRLWTAGFRVAAGTLASDLSSNQTTVRYTPIGQPTVWPTENTIGGSSTIGGFGAYGDNWVTGFGEFTDGTGDWLLVLLNSKIYAVSQTGDSLAPFAISERGAIQNGCVHQRAFVSLGLDSGDAIYMSSRGIHSLRQSQEFGARSETFLSWKIRNTFENINQSAITKSVGAYDATLGIVIFFVPTGSNTSPNLGLVLDVKNKKDITAENAEWDLWTLGGTGNDALVTALATATNAAGSIRVHAGNAGGDVMQLDADTASDLASAYAVEMRTKHNDYGEQSFEKQCGDIWIGLQPGGNHTPSFKIIYDYGAKQSSTKQLRMVTGGDLVGTLVVGTGIIGAASSNIQDKVYGMGSGQSIAFDFSHYAADEQFYISSISPEIAILGEQGPGAGATD